MIHVILDNGHGEETPGKRSPDGRLLEYKYTRKIVDLLFNKLNASGICIPFKLVTETSDISLKERCKRVNHLCKEFPKACLISIHCNAAGNGSGWLKANGWSAFIGLNSSKNSKLLANLLVDNAEKLGLKIRPCSSTQRYWAQSLAMCRDTDCPAVLTENLFQDNKSDVDFLLSDKGIETIVDLHYNAIKQYTEELK